MSTGIQLTFQSAGRGTCSLTGRDCEGITVTFEDGTLSERFLSYKSLARLISLKLGPTPAKSRTPGGRQDGSTAKPTA